MATIIRSAHVAKQSRILPVRPSPAVEIAPPQPPAAPAAAPASPLAGAMPPSTLPSHAASPRATAETRSTLTPEPAYTPRLSPEREATLLEENRIAREQAVKEGYSEGFEHGSREARETLAEKQQALAELLNSVQESLQSQIVGLEDVIVSLAFEALCKILGNALHDRDGVRAIVQEVMCRAKSSETLTIRVSPTDYYLLVPEQGSLQQEPHSPKLTVVPDERVSMGGCLIETSGGTLDGRLETQLQQLKEALLLAKRQRPDRKEPSSAL